jgi:hypothetical protein
MDKPPEGGLSCSWNGACGILSEFRIRFPGFPVRVVSLGPTLRFDAALSKAYQRAHHLRTFSI